MVVNVVSLRRSGRWDAPPLPGDTQDYDNLALNLLHGKGFGFDWDDPEWRAPYAAHNDAGVYDGILARSGPYVPTAYRPPLLPVAIAGSYAIFGRSFLAWGLINCAIASAAVALAALLALRLAGTGPALAGAAITLLDGNLRWFAAVSGYLSEGLSCLAVVLLVWALGLLIERRSPGRLVLAGASLGLLPLIRSIFVLWYLPAALVVLWIGSRKGGQGHRISPLLALALFLGGAILVPFPWWARNCALLGEFMPLGTQGGRNLPLGYSDVALVERGVWTGPSAGRWWSQYDAAFEGMSPLEEERERAVLGQRKAIEWALANPRKVPDLVLAKLLDLWSRPLPGRVLRVFAALALLAIAPTLRRPALLALWMVIAFDTLAVVLTYGDGVRFLVPVLPLLHVLIGIGLWRVLVWPARRLSPLLREGRVSPAA